MKTGTPLTILLLICVGALIVVSLRYRAETIALRKSNAEMLSAIDKPGQREIYDVPKEKQDGSFATKEEQILRENRKLRSSVEQLTAELASSENEKLELQSELNDLLKPIREDILSSTLNAHLNTGEALVTGGFKLQMEVSNTRWWSPK